MFSDRKPLFISLYKFFEEIFGEHMSFLYVAFGGALGAVIRYAISLIPVKTEFPILTLITNIIGAILIGFIVGIVNDKNDVSPNIVLFWKTGVCGGFTTFSTFSLEALNLLDKKYYYWGSLYIGLSLSFCILGVILGKRLVLLFK